MNIIEASGINIAKATNYPEINVWNIYKQDQLETIKKYLNKKVLFMGEDIVHVIGGFYCGAEIRLICAEDANTTDEFKVPSVWAKVYTVNMCSDLFFARTRDIKIID